MKFKNTILKTSQYLGASVLSMTTAVSAFAANPNDSCMSGSTPGAGCDLSALNETTTTSIKSGISLIYLVSAIVGIGFIVSGIMKLKAHALDMQQTSGAGKHAVYLFIVGACLIAIPIILLLASGSLFGSEGITLPSEKDGLDFSSQ